MQIYHRRCFRIFLKKVQKMHPVKLNSYEECWHLFKYNMNIYNLDFQLNLKDYGEWISKHTIKYAYKEYKYLLSIISKSKNYHVIAILVNDLTLNLCIFSN